MTHASTVTSGTQARALVTGAASDPTVAALVGSIFDLVQTLRRDHGASSAAMPVLVRLSADGPLRACDLADLLHLDQSTVSRHVATLEADGLVQRAPNEGDRRSHLLVPTPQGELAVQQRVEEQVARFENAVAGWAPDDVATLTRLLTSLTDGLAAPERNHP